MKYERKNEVYCDPNKKPQNPKTLQITKHWLTSQGTMTCADFPPHLQIMRVLDFNRRRTIQMLQNNVSQMGRYPKQIRIGLWPP